MKKTILILAVMALAGRVQAQSNEIQVNTRPDGMIEIKCTALIGGGPHQDEIDALEKEFIAGFHSAE